MEHLRQVILLMESSRGAGRAFLRGFAGYARHHGAWSFHWEPGGLNEIWPRLNKLAAHGIVLRDGKNIHKVLALGLPTVVVGHQQEVFPGAAHVLTDSLEAGRLVAEHLTGCGFGHFAFYGPSGIRWSETRRLSFQDCLARSGRTVKVFDAPADTAGARAGNPAPGFGPLAAIPPPNRSASWRATMITPSTWSRPAGTPDFHPDQVGLVGVDNDELVCELSSPPLSSVAINFEHAGFESARLLDRWMQQGTVPLPARISAPATHVVPRLSTDILAVGGPPVAQGPALHPRSRPRKPPRDPGRARRRTSRRALENRFRWELGRSILQEIRRIRVDLIARMLLETDLPVSHIAGALGYDNLRHIARYFRREKNLSLAAFRKKYGAK